MLGYDIVLFNPTTSTNAIKSASSQRNTAVAITGSGITELFQRRRNEFKQIFESGKLVVCFVPAPAPINVQTMTAAGLRNEQLNAVDLLGINLSTVLAHGRQIRFKKDKNNEALEPLISLLKYEARILAPLSAPFMFISGTQEVVGDFHKVRSGQLLLLPHFMGPPATADSKVLVDVITTLYDHLRKRIEHETPPAWLTFASRYERSLAESVQQLDAQRSILEQRLEEERSQLREAQAWSRLLYASGKELEEQVGRSLSLMGFEVVEGPTGRDDLIATFEDRVVVVEVKGKSKSGSEMDAMQLEKWINNYALKNEGRLPKGLLVVNAYRMLPPDERSDPAFPDQMLTFSKPRSHALLTGIQLYQMAMLLLGDPSLAARFRTYVLETSGPLTLFTTLGDSVVYTSEP